MLRCFSHERAVFYWRFMGGFGGDSCHHMHNRHSVRSMQDLQSPYSLRTSAKLLKTQAGT
jgi:hypothetical protein